MRKRSIREMVMYSVTHTQPIWDRVRISNSRLNLEPLCLTTLPVCIRVIISLSLNTWFVMSTMTSRHCVMNTELSEQQHILFRLSSHITYLRHNGKKNKELRQAGRKGVREGEREGGKKGIKASKQERKYPEISCHLILSESVQLGMEGHHIIWFLLWTLSWN